MKTPENLQAIQHKLAEDIQRLGLSVSAVMDENCYYVEHPDFIKFKAPTLFKATKVAQGVYYFLKAPTKLNLRQLHEHLEKRAQEWQFTEDPKTKISQ